MRHRAPEADASEWGRWDTRNGRTVYVAGNRQCAFAEVLAYIAGHLVPLIL